MSQWLITNGNAGEAPWWWNPIQASRYLKGAIKPWEWGEESVFWTDATIACQNAEEAARKFHERKAQRKQARRG